MIRDVMPAFSCNFAFGVRSHNGRVAKWITRRPSEPKIAGSSPAVVEDIGHWALTLISPMIRDVMPAFSCNFAFGVRSHNGRVAKWITRRPSEPKIAGSSPAVVEDIGHWALTLISPMIRDVMPAFSCNFAFGVRSHNGRVAKWITRRPSEPKIAGSSPAVVEDIGHWALTLISPMIRDVMPAFSCNFAFGVRSHNGRVAKWITRRPSEPKIAGSSPAVVEDIGHWALTLISPMIRDVMPAFSCNFAFGVRSHNGRVAKWITRRPSEPKIAGSSPAVVEDIGHWALTLISPMIRDVMPAFSCNFAFGVRSHNGRVAKWITRRPSEPKIAGSSPAVVEDIGHWALTLISPMIRDVMPAFSCNFAFGVRSHNGRVAKWITRRPSEPKIAGSSPAVVEDIGHWALTLISPMIRDVMPAFSCNFAFGVRSHNGRVAKWITRRPSEPKIAGSSPAVVEDIGHWALTLISPMIRDVMPAFSCNFAFGVRSHNGRVAKWITRRPSEPKIAGSSPAVVEDIGHWALTLISPMIRDVMPAFSCNFAFGVRSHNGRVAKWITRRPSEPKIAGSSPAVVEDIGHWALTLISPMIRDVMPAFSCNFAFGVRSHNGRVAKWITRRPSEPKIAGSSPAVVEDIGHWALTLISPMIRDVMPAFSCNFAFGVRSHNGRVAKWITRRPSEPKIAGSSPAVVEDIGHWALTLISPMIRDVMPAFSCNFAFGVRSHNGRVAKWITRRPSEPKIAGSSPAVVEDIGHWALTLISPMIRDVMPAFSCNFAFGVRSHNGRVAKWITRRPSEPKIAGSSPAVVEDIGHWALTLISPMIRDVMPAFSCNFAFGVRSHNGRVAKWITRRPSEPKIAGSSPAVVEDIGHWALTLISPMIRDVMPAFSCNFAFGVRSHNGRVAKWITRRPSEPKIAGSSPAVVEDIGHWALTLISPMIRDVMPAFSCNFAFGVRSHNGRVAKWITRRPSEPKIAGSSPAVVEDIGHWALTLISPMIRDVMPAFSCNFAFGVRSHNGRVAKWITRRPSEPKIAGSSPAVVEDIGHWALTLISPMIRDVMPAFSCNFAFGVRSHNGRVAKWITRRPSEPKIAGSSPAVVEDIGHWALTLISPMIRDVMPAFSCNFAFGVRSHNGRVAKWITRPPSEPKIEGSSPAVVEDVGHWAIALISPMIRDVMPAFSCNFAFLISQILASRILNRALLKGL
ncbi:hypothetical protein Tcan_03533 [Toxocara canis]|uniref:Uncharacterized protein n=1 Tax=Toxocara canis TaxID=6265 RepID=A0A0B2VL19_TOXCA|nr:hypothetical protein Tcan_03533 [Toxocara canis]